MAEEPTVTYTVREMLSRMDGKLDIIAAQLAGKASQAEVEALTERLGKVERAAEVDRVVATKLKRWVLVGVPSFTGFAAAAIGIVFRFVR